VSEFLAEAEVLIRPNTAGFRTTLIAELTKATRGIVVPIPVVAQARGAQAVTQANRAAAGSAQQAAVATKELEAARTKQAIADRQAAAAEANLVQAQRLTAAAQQRVIAVDTAGARSTSALAAARAELRAANVAVTASIRAVDAAMLEGAAAAQALAVETLRSAVALRAEAIAAEQAAAAKVLDTRATRADAVAHEQFTRGIEAETLSLFGVRGATLAASKGFLIGAASVVIGTKAVEEASREQEAASRVAKVFGEDTERLAEDAKGFADAFGLSVAASLKFEGAIGNILQEAGVARVQIPQMSEDLLKLAADMAAFNNVPVEATLKALQLGILGNSRGLRQFGVELSASAVNARALTASGKETTDQLTSEDRALARIAIIFEKTTNQQGAAARRAKDLAQQTKILKAEIDNVAADIGRLLIPALVNIVGAVHDDIAALKDLTGALGSVLGPLKQLGDQTHTTGIFQTLLGHATRLAISPLAEYTILVEKAVHALQDHNRETQHGLGIIGLLEAKLIPGARAFLNLQQNIDAARKAIEKFGDAAARLDFKEQTNQLDTLNEKLLKVQIAGGTLQQQLAAAQDIEAKAAARARSAARVSAREPKSEQAQEARRAAERDLLDAINQRKAIQQEIADKAADAAQAAKDAAEKIQQAIEDAKRRVQELLDRADEAALDLIERLARPFDIRALRVAATKSLQDDIAFQNDLQNLLKRQIHIAQTSITDAKKRAAEVQRLTVELVTSQIAEKQLRAQVAENAAERRKARIDRQAESIDLDIELAQTQKNVRGEIAARQRRIKFDQERLKAVRGDIIATKRLRNDIAAQRAAIKELKKELEKRRDALKEVEFLFLQEQAGFVANLLSNIIPRAQIAGTVGGTVGGPGGVSTATPVAPRAPAAPAGAGGPSGGGGGGLIGFGERQIDLVGVGATPTRRDDLRDGVGTTVQTRQAQRGASMSQMSTLIHIQRGMLQVLTRLVAQRTHPEANTQRHQQAVALDTVYGV
jgi:chemotaxis protein histidine kinase CheA